MFAPKVVIVRTAEGQRYADFIAKEINLAGFHCGITDIKNLKSYLKEKKYSPGHTIIHPRTAHPDYVYRVLKDIEKKGYKIINSPETIKLTSDKFKTYVYAKEKGIPCIETIKVRKEEGASYAKEKIKQWNQIIVKPLTSQGQGKFCFRFDRNNINQIKKIKNIPTPEIIIQKFINYQKLNRVIVIGLKALKKAALWDMPHKDWKCSVCLNPMIKCYKNPPKALLKFAENVAKKFNGEIFFVDIFTTRKGYFLNEINTACSLIIHERISRYNISKEIAKHLLK